MKDLRNAKARARDDFFESATGQNCIIGSASGQYLKNRVECGFIEGWDAAIRFNDRMYNAQESSL